MPKKTWIEVAKTYVKKCNLSGDLAPDRSKRRKTEKLS